MDIIKIEKNKTYKLIYDDNQQINIKFKENGDIEINKPIGEIFIKPQYANQILIKGRND